MRPWGSAGEKLRLAPSTARRAWGPLQPHIVDEERDIVVGDGLPRRCAKYAACHRVVSAALEPTHAPKANAVPALLAVSEGDVVGILVPGDRRELREGQRAMHSSKALPPGTKATFFHPTHLGKQCHRRAGRPCVQKMARAAWA